METDFFKYLFEHLRKNAVSVHYSLPPNTTYPACECELVESQSYQERCVITFKIKVYGDTTSHGKLQAYASTITKCLEGQSHTIEVKDGNPYAGSIRLTEKAIEPPQKGGLRILYQTYQALLS